MVFNNKIYDQNLIINLVIKYNLFTKIQIKSGNFAQDQGEIREKSGNFISHSEWEPWYIQSNVVPPRLVPIEYRPYARYREPRFLAFNPVSPHDALKHYFTSP